MSASLRGARVMTTTVWQPIVIRDSSLMSMIEPGVAEKEGATEQGTKRKRAPHTKGPCEHGVKYRSNCKVCSGCPHGRWRSSVQGVRWCRDLRARSYTQFVQGVRWGINLRARSSALSVQGVRWGINLRARIVYAPSAKSVVV